MISAPPTLFSDDGRYWVLHPKVKRRKSPNGINLVFIPGQNVVLELNEVAGDVMEAFAQAPVTYQALLGSLQEIYDVDDVVSFQDEIDQLLERFAKHSLIVPQSTDTVGEGQK